MSPATHCMKSSNNMPYLLVFETSTLEAKNKIWIHKGICKQILNKLATRHCDDRSKTLKLYVVGAICSSSNDICTPPLPLNVDCHSTEFDSIIWNLDSIHQIDDSSAMITRFWLYFTGHFSSFPQSFSNFLQQFTYSLLFWQHFRNSFNLPLTFNKLTEILSGLVPCYLTFPTLLTPFFNKFLSLPSVSTFFVLLLNLLCRYSAIFLQKTAVFSKNFQIPSRSRLSTLHSFSAFKVPKPPTNLYAILWSTMLKKKKQKCVDDDVGAPT